jgi:tRNA G10  N-methylase Trm11
MQYLYTFGFRPDEQELCRLEQRAFFSRDSEASNYLISDVAVEPKRSPFIRERVALVFVAHSFDELLLFAERFSTAGRTYKVVSINDDAIGSEPKLGLRKRREMEIAVGGLMDGEVDLLTPEVEFAIAQVGTTFYFGELVRGEAVWLQHIERPVPYSTALSTKHARALVNITAPVLDDVRIVDPCCGVGTVVIEALSMGANILGRDMNWFVTSGSRQNIEHFGYDGVIELGPIEAMTETFDAAIIDMPYNVFTHSSDVDKQSIINSARRIARRVVFVSSEDLREGIEQATFTIVDECRIKKHKFVRNVYVCE